MFTKGAQHFERVAEKKRKATSRRRRHHSAVKAARFRDYRTGKQSRSLANTTGPEYRFLISD